MNERRSAADGFTLLELTVVLAVFSVVAVLSLGSLSGALLARERIGEVGSRTSEFAAAAALLRRDLEAMVPASIKQSGDFPSSPFAVSDTSQRLSLFAAGQWDIEANSNGNISQIDWYLDRSDATLWRSTRTLGTEAPAESVPVLTGVSNWRVGVRYDDGSASAGSDWLGADNYSLPRGVDVRFDIENLGNVRVLVAR